MRMIDAGYVMKAINRHLKHLPVGQYEAGFNDGLNTAMLEIMAALTPPNEPLTLDELRKMKDEPTYLKVFDPLLKSGWHIVKAVTEDKIIFRDWQTVYVPIDGMGVDYNLYRRPPEGEEDIK